MSTTVIPSSLQVDIAEKITLNGTTYDSVTTQTIADINSYTSNVFRFTGGAPQKILTFSPTPRDGEYAVGRMQYMRLTNNDDTNELIVTLTYTSTISVITVKAGGSFILTDFVMGGVENLVQVVIQGAIGSDVSIVLALNDNGETPGEAEAR